MLVQFISVIDVDLVGIFDVDIIYSIEDMILVFGIELKIGDVFCF